MHVLTLVTKTVARPPLKEHAITKLKADFQKIRFSGCHKTAVKQFEDLELRVQQEII
jgi:hypothetical protein